MPEHHAILSPSAAHRWIQCPASIRMASLIPKPAESAVSSPYAQEGTIAHTVAELTARYLVLGGITEEAYHLQVTEATEGLDDDDRADMIRHGEDYARLLAERLAAHPHSKLLLEQQLPTGIPSCWGTSDAVIVSPEHVEVVDYKYGQGIAVSAVENPQLMLYAVGALEAYGDLLGSTETVYCTIFQPRIGDGAASTWSLPAKDLRHWRNEVAVIGEEALGDDAHFGPSEEACRFCPAAGECRARMEAATAEDFGTDPDLLSPREIGELLGRVPEIRAWCGALEDAALRKAYSESVAIPGWKVVMSGGRRSIPDVDGALEVLFAAGYSREQVATMKLRGIGELEKLLGKKRFTALLGDLAIKGAGSPSLASEDDPRPAVSPNTEAEKEFSDGE